MTNPPRRTQPFRWGALAATVTLATSPAFAASQPAPITLAHPDTRLWLAQSQGGEAGEAGITSQAPGEAAYLAELAIIEGHMRAARDLYAMGLQDQAVALSRHPQQEGTLDALRVKIAAHAAPDPQAVLIAFTTAIATGADLAKVDAALAAVSQAFAAAASPEAAKTRARFDAVVLLLKAAAGEYAASIEQGAVTDIMGWHEALSFVVLARLRLAELAAIPLSAKAAPKALAALSEADTAFGNPAAAIPLAGDIQILLGIAARVELIASSVR